MWINQKVKLNLATSAWVCQPNFLIKNLFLLPKLLWPRKKVLNMWDDPIYKTFYYTQIVSNQDYGIGFNDTTYIMMTWKGEFH